MNFFNRITTTALTNIIAPFYYFLPFYFPFVRLQYFLVLLIPSLFIKYSNILFMCFYFIIKQIPFMIFFVPINLMIFIS